jgi:hypothetical protein
LLPVIGVAKTDTWEEMSNPLFIADNDTEFKCGYWNNKQWSRTKNWSGPLSLTYIPRADNEVIFPTSQRGEGMAILMVLEKAIACGAKCDIEIVTDSKFWITMIETYMPKWHREGTSFLLRKNPDIVWRMWRAIQIIKDEIGELKLRHIYSHGKDWLKLHASQYL